MGFKPSLFLQQLGTDKFSLSFVEELSVVILLWFYIKGMLNGTIKKLVCLELY